MKQQFRKIYHVQTEKGLTTLPFAPKVSLYKQEAEEKNNHWEERGVKYVPDNLYQKFLQNSSLLN